MRKICNTDTEIIDMGIGLLPVIRLHSSVEKYCSPALPKAGIYNVSVALRAKPHLLKCAWALLTQPKKTGNNS
jgi:hypothetical protein